MRLNKRHKKKLTQVNSSARLVSKRMTLLRSILRNPDVGILKTQFRKAVHELAVDAETLLYYASDLYDELDPKAK